MTRDNAPEDRRISPAERTDIMEREIAAMAAAGYRVVKRFDHVAVLEADDARSHVEIFIDGQGEVRHA